MPHHPVRFYRYSEVPPICSTSGTFGRLIKIFTQNLFRKIPLREFWSYPVLALTPLGIGIGYPILPVHTGCPWIYRSTSDEMYFRFPLQLLLLLLNLIVQLYLQMCLVSSFTDLILVLEISCDFSQSAQSSIRIRFSFLRCNFSILQYS